MISRRSWIPWVICLGTGILAGIGWLRPRPVAGTAEVQDALDALETAREDVAAAGLAERLRLVDRLGRLGSREGTAAVLDLLARARNDYERRAAILKLGQLGSPAAVRALTEIAATEGHRLRAHAIRALGAAGTTEAVDSLLGILRNEQGGMRPRSIAALGAAGGERAVAALLELARDPAEVARTDAIEALGATGSEDGLPLLKELVAGGNGPLQKAALDALGQIGTPEAREQILNMTGSGPRDLRVAAVGALAAFSGPEDQSRLAALAGDADQAVARAAVDALSGMDGPVARQALQDALYSRSADLRSEAAAALAESGDPAGIATMIDMLQGGRYSGWVAGRLADSGHPLARKALLDAAASGSGDAAAAAVGALGDLPGEEVDALLRGALSSASPAVASSALEVLAKRQGSAALPLLRDAAREGSADLRRAAMRAMAELGDPAARPLLLAAARSGDYGVARTAVDGLVALGGPDLQATLERIAASGSPWARGQALDALAERGGPRARELLLASLSSGSSTVSSSAASAVGATQDPEVSRRLAQMIDDPNVSAEAKQRIVSIWSDQRDQAGLLRAARHASGKVATEALEALGKHGGAAAEHLLADVAARGDTERRKAAVKGLTELGTPGAVRNLGQALRDPELAEVAIRGLVEVGTRQAMEALQDRYTTASSEQRLAIIGQLDGSAGPEARAILTTALVGRDEKAAAEAGRILAQQPGEDVDSHLLGLLRSMRDPAARSTLAKEIRSADTTFYRTYRQIIDAALLPDEG